MNRQPAWGVSQGTIEGMESAYLLDNKHYMEKGRPMLVCGNTAAMCGEDGVSWLKPHFTVRSATHVIKA